jgi:hypothetical protein
MKVAQHFSAGLAFLTRPSRQGRLMLAIRQGTGRDAIFSTVPVGTDPFFPT